MLRKGAPYVAGFLTGLLATGLLLLLAAEPRGDPITLHPPPTSAPIRVHVAGEVESPGVYTLPIGSIAEAAVAAAGGFTDKADPDALNLAEPLSEGQRVFVPGGVSTEQALVGSDLGNSSAGVGLIPINRAMEPELENLPGIGPSLATAIVDYRRDHGEFTSVEELLFVPGIGPAKLEGIRDLITLH